MKNLTRLKRDLSITVTIELLTKIPLYAFEFLLASWLVMEQYAEWAALALIYRIAPYAHFGALSYFNKRYPKLLGAGQHAAAKKITSHINKIVNLVIFISLAITIILYLLHFLSTPLVFVIYAVLLIQIFTYCQAKVRNEGDFYSYCVGLIIFSVLQFLIAFITVRKYGVLAGVLSTFAAYLAAVIYYLYVNKTAYYFQVPKLKNFNRVIKLGWAPFLLTISSFLTQTSDRIALIFVADETKLAFYGFFSIFFQIGIIAINSLGKVLGPYILNVSGKKDVSSTLSISINTCYVIISIFIMMTFVLLNKGDWMINHYFLKFNGGLLGVYNYASMGFLLALTISFYPQILASNKESLIIRINMYYFVVSVLVVFVLAKYSSGFYYYSLGSLTLNFIYTIIFFIIIERIVKSKILLVRFSLLFISLLVILINIFYK